MNPTNQPVNHIIEQLQERAKELHTLYKVHELINQPDATVEEVCRSMVEVDPSRVPVPERVLGEADARQHRLPAAARDGDGLGAPVRRRGAEPRRSA